MSIVITPITEIQSSPFEKNVFLAGTIEMGNSEDWQAMMVQKLSPLDIGVFNPRRVVPPENNLEIVDQITWELNSIHFCNIIYMYLAKNTISPISLLEMGLLQGSHANGKKMIVFCEPGYLRELNVFVTLNHPFYKNWNIELFSNFEESFDRLLQIL